MTKMVLVILEGKWAKFVHEKVLPVSCTPHMVSQVPPQKTDSYLEICVQQDFVGQALEAIIFGKELRQKDWGRSRCFKGFSQSQGKLYSWYGPSKMPQVKLRWPDLMHRQVIGHRLSQGRDINYPQPKTVLGRDSFVSASNTPSRYSEGQERKPASCIVNSKDPI